MAMMKSDSDLIRQAWESMWRLLSDDRPMEVVKERVSKRLKKIDDEMHGRKAGSSASRKSI